MRSEKEIKKMRNKYRRKWRELEKEYNRLLKEGSYEACQIKIAEIRIAKEVAQMLDWVLEGGK